MWEFKSPSLPFPIMIAIFKNIKTFFSNLWKTDEPSKGDTLPNYPRTMGPIVCLSRDDLRALEGCDNPTYYAIAAYYDYINESFVIFLADKTMTMVELPMSAFDTLDTGRINPENLELIHQGGLIRVGQRIWISTRKILEMIEDEKIRKRTTVSRQIAA